MEQQIKSFLSQSNHVQWCVFFLFTLTIFFKCCLFHYFCFYTIYISSLWKAPLSFLLFYIPKLAPAITLGSIVFITKRHWWTVLVCIILDIWIFANLIYFRANELFLNYDAISMAGNMHGFWASIGTYCNTSYLFVVLTTIVYIAIWAFLYCLSHQYPKNRRKVLFIMFLLLGIILHIFSHSTEYLYTKKITSENKEDALFFKVHMKEDAVDSSFRTWKQFIPLRFVIAHAQRHNSSWIPTYIKEQSIIQYGFAICIYDIITPSYGINSDSIDVPERICKSNHNGISRFKPSSNLIIILVESFESWVFENEKYNIAPNMASLLSHPHVLYCPKVTSQVRHGVSADGQMTLSTGLLPIQSGSASYIYGGNVYPNYAHFYDSTYLLNPTRGTWNQEVVTENYGYRKLIQRNDMVWEDDARTFEKTDSLLKKIGNDTFCIMAISIASHSPFKAVPICNDYKEIRTPKYIKEYISCIHYTDSCLRFLIDKLENDTFAQNSTLVITGDHTIFKPSMKEFQVENVDLCIPEISYVPLIIYSQQIKENIQIKDICYQMDIYPTIMNLIGCEDYYWKGFGVNLLDSAARKSRPMTEIEAYELSDKLIRSNYFAKIEQ